MQQLQDLLAMGDHGFYVWLSYGLTLSVILVLVVQARGARRRFARLAKARQQRHR